MLITIDIGNTNTVIGLFKDEQLAGTWRVGSDTHRTADEYRFILEALLKAADMGPHKVQGACIASVVPQLTATWQQLCSRCFNTQALVVGAEAQLGITLRYDNPLELGIDRALAAAAAYRRFKTDLIVLDFGTATTIDYVSAQGVFMGGSIMPGFGHCGRSPCLKRPKNCPALNMTCRRACLGTNTVSCLQIGILGGYCLMVEAMTARIKQQVQGTPAGDRHRWPCPADCAPHERHR